MSLPIIPASSRRAAREAMFFGGQTDQDVDAALEATGPDAPTPISKVQKVWLFVGLIVVIAIPLYGMGVLRA